MVIAAMKLNSPWKKSYEKPKQPIKGNCIIADKGLYSQSYGFFQ